MLRVQGSREGGEFRRLGFGRLGEASSSRAKP